eukprot:2427381-Pyramimonas_sp.AAC.1
MPAVRGSRSALRTASSFRRNRCCRTTPVCPCLTRPRHGARRMATSAGVRTSGRWAAQASTIESRGSCERGWHAQRTRSGQKCK